MGVKRRTLIILGAAGAILAALATPVAAQADDPSAVVQAALDNAWVVLAGVLVFVMQAGFALVETGLTRVKNTANILAKNLADMCIGAVAFLAVGYGLAFGRGNAWWGTEGFFLAGSDLAAVGSSGFGNITTGAFFFFHAVFAAAAVTIASGAMAERARFKAYLLFSVAMSAFVYPLVVHWTWGGGFLADMSIAGARFGDFAGSDGRAPHRRVRGGWRAPCSWGRAWASTPRRGRPARSPATQCRWCCWACSSSGSAGSGSTPARSSPPPRAAR